MVTLPQGTLGPRTATPVNPATVTGISKSDDTWVMNRDWDETIHGGYLDFGVSRLLPKGHTVLGFKMECGPIGGGAHMIRSVTQNQIPELGYFEITNPNQFVNSTYLNGHMHAHHYICRGVTADCVKNGSSHHEGYHHDAFWTFNPIPSGDTTSKHVDGAQYFNTATGRLERIVVDWNEAGTVAQTTGALFTQDGAGMYARNILILNPGGTFRICRLHGTGVNDLDFIQAIGVQKFPGKFDTLTPTHIVLIAPQRRFANLFNDVPGAGDWMDP